VQRREEAAKLVQHAWRLLLGRRALRDRGRRAQYQWWRHWRRQHRRRRAAGVIQRYWRLWRRRERSDAHSPTLVTGLSPVSVMSDVQLEQGVAARSKQRRVQRCLSADFSKAVREQARLDAGAIAEAEAYLRARLGGTGWRQQVELNLQAARRKLQAEERRPDVVEVNRQMARQLELFLYPKQTRYR
jgi:hypothetical protein